MLTKEMIDVLEHIPKGQKNAISRTELCASVGYGDRKTRDIIAYLRERGYLICSLQKGYFIAEKPEEAERYYQQEKARAISILKALSPMRKYLKEEGRMV